MVIRYLLLGLLGLAACGGDAASGSSTVTADAVEDDDFGLGVDTTAPAAIGDAVAPEDVTQVDIPDVAADPAPAGMGHVAPGTFWMGCNSAKAKKCGGAELPQHAVTLSGYDIDLTETTVGQYKACVAAGVCKVPDAVQWTQYATYPGLTNNPVNFISWTQAQQYCKWRGAGYDLPTEAQWEMAARGSCDKNGSTASDPNCATAMRTYPWGEAAATCSYVVMDSSDYGFGCGTFKTWAVGSLPAGDSPYGLHDMAGNVAEWTRDWYETYPATAQVDPLGPSSGEKHVMRGGSFFGDVSVTFRVFYDPAPYGMNISGFRCIRAVP